MPCRPIHRTLILVLAYSGVRWGEAVALRRGRCDLLRGRLEVLESATEVNGHLSWGLPKTHRQRTVSIPRFVCEDLAEHFVGAPEGADQLVLEAGGGGPLRHHNFLRYVWRPAVAEAELPRTSRHTSCDTLPRRC